MRKLLLLVLLLSGCSIVSSLNTAQVEQVSPNQVKVTTLASGLLTIASTENITAFRGADLSRCSLESALGVQARGIICRGVVRGFVVNLDTVGTVAARVTQTPDSRERAELEFTARQLEGSQ
jgi:hypothetical protein